MITTCQQCGGLRADHLESFAGTPCRCHSFPALGSVNDTPETDALQQKLWGEEWSDSYLAMMIHARKLESERDAIAAALQETLALLNHSDTSYPSQEGWWSYERARELEALIPQNFGAHTRREQPLNTTMPNDKQTTSESPPCDADSSPECDQCHHWEYDDGRHGFMSGYCPIFQKVTHREHGTQCTAWARIHLENAKGQAREASPAPTGCASNGTTEKEE